MKIESISEAKNNIKILLDNGEKLFLRLEVFLKSALRKGDEISEEEISGLIRQNQFYFVKESAFRFLGRRIHSEKELQRKLSAKKYDKEIISQVLRELRESHYLDDEQFAREFSEEKISRKAFGQNKLKAELRARGVSQEIIDRVLEAKPADVEFENALSLAEKKLSSLKGRNLDGKKITQRLYAYLLSKGFDYDVIKAAVGRLNATGDDDEEE
ncbi:MAG: regulatory protein RecX [Ignavibacteria bacterium]|jgi:regulatory protein|nr:regulatory protein RecX [Ignavibacteria bacterium]MCU7505101.1 regulatory protein RecX [Ignavibacteria bacterium]MCU7518067.1 regulatory protein RecX [Ignavibacteria bacterium]